MKTAVGAQLAGCVVLAWLGAVESPAACAGDPTAIPDDERRVALVRLVRNDCGSCHGRTLAGGLGPALTRDALREKPGESVAATIFYGRPGTPMPSWSPFLTESEAAWIAAELQRGFPDATN
jgi:cytochrome c55X